MEMTKIVHSLSEKMQLEVESLGRAMINNNTNNNNNILTIITSNDFADSDNQKLVDFVTPGQASPSPSSSSQEASRGIGSAATPPWRYIKLDLFNNATPQEDVKGITKLKLKLNFLIPGDNEYHRVIASMSGRWRDIKRGMDLTGNQADIKHYARLEEVYKIYKECFTEVSASKCYQSKAKGKGDIVLGLSVILGAKPTAGEYSVAIVYDTEVQSFELDGLNLTKKQRLAGQISTAQWGTSVAKRFTFQDLIKGKQNDY